MRCIRSVRSQNQQVAENTYRPGVLSQLRLPRRRDHVIRRGLLHWSVVRCRVSCGLLVPYALYVLAGRMQSDSGISRWTDLAVRVYSDQHVSFGTPCRTPRLYASKANVVYASDYRNASCAPTHDVIP